VLGGLGFAAMNMSGTPSPWPPAAPSGRSARLTNPPRPRSGAGRVGGQQTALSDEAPRARRCGQSSRSQRSRCTSKGIPAWRGGSSAPRRGKIRSTRGRQVRPLNASPRHPSGE
jgi:hypothetical protein